MKRTPYSLLAKLVEELHEENEELSAALAHSDEQRAALQQKYNALTVALRKARDMLKV